MTSSPIARTTRRIEALGRNIELSYGIATSAPSDSLAPTHPRALQDRISSFTVAPTSRHLSN